MYIKQQQYHFTYGTYAFIHLFFEELNIINK